MIIDIGLCPTAPPIAWPTCFFCPYSSPLFCNISVCRHAAVGNFAQQFPYLLSKLTSFGSQRNFGRVGPFAFKIAVKPILCFMKQRNFVIADEFFFYCASVILLPLHPQADKTFAALIASRGKNSYRGFILGRIIQGICLPYRFYFFLFIIPVTNRFCRCPFIKDRSPS